MFYIQQTTGATKGNPALDTLDSDGLGLNIDTFKIKYYHHGVVPPTPPVQDYILKYKTSDGQAYDFSVMQNEIKQYYPDITINTFISNSATTDGYWSAYFTNPITMNGARTEGEEYIEMGPFCGMYGSATLPFTEVIFDDSLIELCGNGWGGSFYGDSALTNVTLGNNLTTIGPASFKNCSALASITIPNSVTTIGDWAFYGCSFDSLDLSNTSITTIGNNAFGGNMSLRSLVFPATVTSLGSKLVYNNGIVMSSITVLATTPPTIQSDTFEMSEMLANLIIYVPASSYDAYTAAWNSIEPGLDIQRIQS